MTDRDDAPRVLLADDQASLVEMYELFINDDYDVVTASGGAEVIERIDESVAAVVLDRRMPKMTGDETLTALRDRGYETPVGMVSAVGPGDDIVGLPMDAYLTKPVGREGFRKLVELLLARRNVDERSRTLLRLASKKAVLEAAGRVGTNGSAIADLERQMDAVRTELANESEASVPDGVVADVHDLVS